jgi:hypothetical protein
MRVSAYTSYPFFSNISKIPLVFSPLPFSENVNDAEAKRPALREIERLYYLLAIPPASTETRSGGLSKYSCRPELTIRSGILKVEIRL